MAVLLAGTFARASEPLTWQDCVRLAAEQNPDLVAAREQVAAAEAGTQVARSALLPQLSLGGSAQHIEEDSDRNRGIGDESFNASLDLTQSLFSGGQKQARVRVADATLVETQAGADVTGVETTFQLRTSFVNLLYAQQQIELLRGIRDRRATNSEMVELRYEGGLEHKGSLASSQAALYEADVDLKQAWREAGVTRQILLRVIGSREGPADLRISGDVAELHVPGAIDTAYLAHQTPEYQQALASREGAEAGVKVARSGFLPNVDLESSAGRSGDEDSFTDDRWDVGVRVTFPFWPGGKNLHEYRQARANLAQAEATVRGTENALVADLERALLALRNAAEDVRVQRTQLEASELRADISREQYANGLLSFDDWDIIENELITRRKRLLDVQRDALLAEAAWWRKSGMTAFRRALPAARLSEARERRGSE